MEFINDASFQTGGSLLSYNTFYTTKVKPTIKLNSNSGIYNIIVNLNTYTKSITLDGRKIRQFRMRSWHASGDFQMIMQK